MNKPAPLLVSIGSLCIGVAALLIDANATGVYATVASVLQAIGTLLLVLSGRRLPNPPAD